MKNEDKTTPIEKLGYGFKYTAAIIFAILAICALCFIFINITTYFAPPLQPMFDQERLGQLGDFLGGTLNPIFGFATVCLLLWSVFIQRKELSLTRDELKKSAIALENQVKLATDEYNRKQLEAIHQEKTNNYNQILKTKFHSQTVIIDRSTTPNSNYSYTELLALEKFLETQMQSGDIIREFFNHSLALDIKFTETLTNLKKSSKEIDLVIDEICKITPIEILKNSYREKNEKRKELFIRIGLIDN